jgi:uncharacterized membrane protein
VASYTPTSPVPEMNIWIYWSESNSCIYFYNILWGFVSFVIVYFQQNKSLLKCMSLWLLSFFIVLIPVCGYINNQILEYYLLLKVLFCYYKPP